MPANPPPTPFFPSTRFTDESLLLTERPIFEDVSLGDDSVWGQDLPDDTISIPSRAGSSSRTPMIHSTPHVASQEARTTDQASVLDLDLDDYLPPPDEVTVILERPDKNLSNPSRAETISSRSYSSSESSTKTHKREGSDSLNAKEAVKLKKRNRDDYYSRRISDSNRRNSGSFSPIHPVISLPSSSSSGSFRSIRQSTSISSRGSDNAISPQNTGGSSSTVQQTVIESSTSDNRGRLALPLERIRNDDGRIGVKGFAANGKIQKHSGTSVLASSTSVRSSALSRYLAKSTLIHPPNNLELRTTTASSSQTGKSTPLDALSAEPSTSLSLGTTKGESRNVDSFIGDADNSQKSSNEVDIPLPASISDCSIAKATVLDDVMLHLPGSLRPAPTSSLSSQTISAVEVESSEHIPRIQDNVKKNDEVNKLPLRVAVPTSAQSMNSSSVPVGEAVPEARPEKEKESRRTSTSERVLGFFAGFLKPTTSNSDTPVTTEQNGQTEVTSSSEENHTHVTPICEAPRSTSSSSSSRPPLSVLSSTNVNGIQLTRPRPFTFSSKTSKPSHSSSASARNPVSSTSSNTQKSAPLRPTRIVSSSSSLKAPVVRTATTSAFASAALARLPPPGKGSTSSAKPVSVKDTERARDMNMKKKVFQGPTVLPSTAPTNKLDQSTSSMGLRRPLPLTDSVKHNHHSSIIVTVPISGKTPGKASRQRAAERERFDAVVREKMEAKERQREAEERARLEKEEEEIRELRKRTVIWAKPVPGMYYSGNDRVDTED